MTYNYDEFGHFFIILDKNINKDIFLSKINVKKNTYSENLFIRMYDSIFSELINIEEEFEKYYKLEYNSLKEFLFKKFCVPKDVIEKMYSIKAERESYCINFKKNYYSYGDYGMVQFTFSEKMYNKVMNILLLKDDES